MTEFSKLMRAHASAVFGGCNGAAAQLIQSKRLSARGLDDM